MLLPQLTPNSDVVVGVPPPPYFRPLVGSPRNVRWKNVPYKASEGLTAAQKGGLRYETKVHDHFSRALGSFYHVQPYLHYEDDSGVHTAKPDAIHLDVAGRATIFEIKSRHTSDAWWQLRAKYEPLVQQLKFVNRVSCVEVAQSYDPAAGFPEQVALFCELDRMLAASSAPFKVLIWKPARY